MRSVAISAFVVLLAALAGAPASADNNEIEGFRLTAPVRHALERLHDGWQGWRRAYYQNDHESADNALQEMLAMREQLGTARLSDLAIAAAAYAARSAAEGNFERAGWALETARALDPERPEITLARARVRRHEGDYLRSVLDLVVGHGQILGLEARSGLLTYDVSLGVLVAILLSGALFVVVQMAVKGGDLFADLERLLAPPLSGKLALPLIVLLLLAPLALPSGLIWLLALWALLLWGYGSPSERAVLTLVMLILGLSPLALRVQQRQARMMFVPPVQAMAALEDDRLYGKLFADLRVLRSTLPESPAVLELEADLHRRLGQWELARARYLEVLEREPGHAAALNNLGVYYFGKQDFGSAIAYFEDAIQADPRLVAAFYNLNLSYSQSYAFSDARQALAQAKELNGAEVDRWLASDEAGSLAIAVEGGLGHRPEIRRALRASWGQAPPGLVRQLRDDLAPLAMVALLLLAVAVHLLRRRHGYGESYSERRDDTPARLRRALIPGYASICRGRGWRAFGAILLPVAIAVAALLSGWVPSYRPRLGYAPEAWLPMTAGALILLLVIMVRIGRELTASERSAG